MHETVNIQELKSLKELKEKLKESSIFASCNGKNCVPIFRGQSEYGIGGCGLVPSLFRPGEDGQFYDETIENKFKNGLERYIEKILELSNVNSDGKIDKEVQCILQHYGGPTKLLDWSLDYDVATCMMIYNMNKENRDGYLFRCDVHPENFNTCSGFTNLFSVYFLDENNEMVGSSINKEMLQVFDPIGFVDKSQHDKNPELIDFIKRINTRINLQKGVFTYWKGESHAGLCHKDILDYYCYKIKKESIPTEDSEPYEKMYQELMPADEEKTIEDWVKGFKSEIFE